MSLEDKGYYYGLYRGFVHRNDDPEFLGRVQVIVPSIYGDDPHEEWAWPRGMYAGNQVGLFAIPSPKDGVWVSFENGDPNFPVWEYGPWYSNQVPEAAKNNGNKPTNKVWQSVSGHRVELDDKPGSEQVVITSKYGDKWVMNSKGVSIVAGKISCGSLDSSSDPAVLGGKLEQLLNNEFDQLNQLCTHLIAFASVQAGVASASPTTAGLTAGFTTLGTSITAVQSALAGIKQTVNTIKSNKNTVD